MTAYGSIAALKNQINAVIYENHQENITGPVLQQILHDVVDTVAALFMGGGVDLLDLLVDNTINWDTVTFNNDGVISDDAIETDALISHGDDYTYINMGDGYFRRHPVIKKTTGDPF